MSQTLNFTLHCFSEALFTSDTSQHIYPGVLGSFRDSNDVSAVLTEQLREVVQGLGQVLGEQEPLEQDLPPGSRPRGFGPRHIPLTIYHVI